MIQPPRKLTLRKDVSVLKERIALIGRRSPLQLLQPVRQRVLFLQVFRHGEGALDPVTRVPLRDFGVSRDRPS